MNLPWKKEGEQPDEPKGGKRVEKKAPKYTGKVRVIYYIYISLTVLAALIVAGYVIFSVMSAPPDVTTKNPENTRRPAQVITTMSAEGEEIEVVVGPGLSDDRKEEFYTFLVVGQSEETGGNLTDTMMLAAYDVPSQALSVMSLPRDTFVNYRGRNVLLNTIYTAAGGGEKGIEALKSEVAELTGVCPDYYVVVKWEAFGELVDAIGGVYYDVPRDMRYYDPTQDLTINVKKGYQLLDGDLAMQVVRFREGVGGYIDGDLGRIRTQQGFMKALVKKCLEPSVLLSNLGNYISIFQKNVDTDLPVGDITYFVKSAVGGLEMDNVTFETLPIKDAGDGAHLLAIPSQVLKTVNQRYNPYLEDIELWELDIVTSIPLPSKAPETSQEPVDPEDSPEPTDPEDPEVTDTPDPTGDPGPALPEYTPEPPADSPAPVVSEPPEDSPPPVEETDPPVPSLPAQAPEERVDPLTGETTPETPPVLPNY